MSTLKLLHGQVLFSRNEIKIVTNGEKCVTHMISARLVHIFSGFNPVFSSYFLLL